MASSRNIQWVDGIKGMAIIGVVLENWARAAQYDVQPGIVGRLPGLAAYGGTLVHLFFLLSGFGLARAWLLRGPVSWRTWAGRRFRKIVVPYWIAVLITYVAAVFLHKVLPGRYPDSYPVTSLLAYLTFMRNLVPSCWELNPSYWFMPVIAGLYVAFPILVMALRRWGATRFAVGSMLFSYAAILAARAIGYPGNHQAALFVFYIPQFALGMLLACTTENGSLNIDRLRGWPSFVTGAGLYGLSTALVVFTEWGPQFNDLLTVSGTMLMAFAVFHWIERSPVSAISHMLAVTGRQSYIIYLVHMPIMTLGAVPYIMNGSSGRANPGILFLLQVLSIPVLPGIAYGISRLKAAAADPSRHSNRN